MSRYIINVIKMNYVKDINIFNNIYNIFKHIHTYRHIHTFRHIHTYRSRHIHTYRHLDI